MFFLLMGNACIGLEDYQKARECLGCALEVAKNINLPQGHAFYVDVKESLEALKEKINVKNGTKIRRLTSNLASGVCSRNSSVGIWKFPARTPSCRPLAATSRQCSETIKQKKQ